MNTQEQTALPYDMGNAGDCLKHGVLAEYICWRREAGQPVRFIDLFGGKPRGTLHDEVRRRLLALPEDCALRTAQTEIADSCYLGSSLVAQGAGARRVLAADRDLERHRRLQAAGLAMLEEDFPDCGAGTKDYDGYLAFSKIICGISADDLVLIDPFAKFLPCYAKKVVPQIASVVRDRHAAVLLFALNLCPRNRVGQDFDKLLEEHLQGAWRVTCPPLPRDSAEVRGESKYHAEVVLAAHSLLAPTDTAQAEAFGLRLDKFVEHLMKVLRPIRLRQVGRREAP